MRCGIDICNVNRIRDSVEKLGESFLKKVFYETEITYCESHKKRKYESYAARFAAKEAVYKAIAPTKKQCGVFTEVEVLNDENGRPYIVLHGELLKIANNLKIDISLSHENDYAIAMCVVDEK